MGFIVIDGLDGSGKSTQANLLANYLISMGKSVCLRAHPSEDNFFGAQARRFLKAQGKSAHFASALFYMLDVVRSIAFYSWRKYDYTIFVRYLMGTAYLPAPLHKISYCFFVTIVPKSEDMLFLDVTPREANRRIKENRTTQEMFEELKALKKVRTKALTLTAMGNWKIINANNPTNQVSQEIKNLLKNNLSPEHSKQRKTHTQLTNQTLPQKNNHKPQKQPKEEKQHFPASSSFNQKLPPHP